MSTRRTLEQIDTELTAAAQKRNRYEEQYLALIEDESKALLRDRYERLYEDARMEVISLHGEKTLIFQSGK
jgi:hypothetical protein